VFARVCDLARRLRLDDRFDLPLMQEAAGRFPSPQRLRNWRPGDTANICIGQGELAVTPMQMAVITAALANGGLVLKPRLVDRLEAQDETALIPPTVFPTRQIRGELGVSAANLMLVREAMLDETEHTEGTGRRAQASALFRESVCRRQTGRDVTVARNRVMGRATAGELGTGRRLALIGIENREAVRLTARASPISCRSALEKQHQSHDRLRVRHCRRGRWFRTSLAG
jgi:hypothetical protein